MRSAAEEDTTNVTQPNMARSGLAVLQDAVKLDYAKLGGPGGPTHLIIYLDGVQVSLEATENVSHLLTTYQALERARLLTLASATFLTIHSMRMSWKCLQRSRIHSKDFGRP